MLERSLGMTSAAPLRMVKQIERGFPFAALIKFHQYSGFSLAEVAQLVQIPMRTFMRRRASGRLDSVESERLLRLARVFDLSLRLFDRDRDAARNWLQTPRPALCNLPPIELAKTDVGAREVEDLIERLQHGVFS